MVTTLKLLANFLRKDLLPKSGREFVADVLDNVAEGKGKSLLPPKHEIRTYSSIAVMVEVEKSIEKRGAVRANQDIFESVGIKLGFKPGTVKKDASKGRGHVREEIARYLKEGGDRKQIIGLMSQAIGLSEARIEGFL
nr:hypothetical protein [Mesorhizobium loti]